MVKHHKINSRLKYWDTLFSDNRILPDLTVRSDRIPTLRFRQYTEKKKVHYGIIFERFRELSTKPKQGLELVSNFETFFGFRETYETPTNVSFCMRNHFRFYETLFSSVMYLFSV
jgi:hypothetical protein